MESKKLLNILSDAIGVSGYEDEAREIILSIVTPLVDEVEVDTLGNLIVRKHGKTDKLLMLDAHMDEIGLMINFIDDNGFLRFAKLGGWDDRILLSHRVTIQTRDRKRLSGIIGNLPPHLMTEEDMKRVTKAEDLFIDIGASSAKEAEEMGVRVGDIAVIHYPFQEITDNYVTGKAFDDRAGCAVIIKCLEALQNVKTDISVAAVFSVSEEKGMSGAKTSAFSIDPDIALVLEGTIGADVPGVEPRKQPVALGKGPAISIADRLISIPRKMWEFIEKLANMEKIPYQFKMPTYSGTNAGAIHTSRAGILTGVVSVPCRYIHSPVSTLRLDDFERTVKLVTKFVKECYRLVQ